MSRSSKSATTSEWMLLLEGFRFHSDEDQMVKLLKKKVQGFMPEVDHGDGDSAGDRSISLFLLFVKSMVQGKDSPACQIIPEIDVCKYEPWDLPELLFPDSPIQPRAWFSFGRPDYKSSKSHSCNRITKHGFWKSTGQPRPVGSQQQSKSVACKKRILTFHEGRASDSKPTDWAMHEYFFAKTKLGSTSNSNQQMDFVLCCLKKKSAKNMSDNGEPGGCGSSGVDNQAVDDMIQELSAQQEKYPDATSFQPEPPRLHQPHQLGAVPDVCNDELLYPRTGGYIASNSSNQAAAINHMIPDPEELLAYKQLEHSLFRNSNHDHGEHGGCVPSDFHEMMQELRAQLGEDFDSSFPPSELPQLGNVPDVNTEECSNRPPPIGDKNNISTDYDNAQVRNITNSFQNRATDESISKVYSQPEKNLEELFHPIQQEVYTICAEGDPSRYNVRTCEVQATPDVTAEGYSSSTLPSPANTELGDVLQANGINDDCNDMQSPLGDNNYSLTDKNDFSTCDEGEPYSFTVSDNEKEAADDMIQEQPQKDLDPFQLQVTQQSPTYTKLGNLMDIDVSNDEYLKWHSPPFGDSTSTFYVNELASNQAADNMILKPCAQPENDLDYCSSTLQSPIYTKLGSVTHADVYNDECSKWQSSIWDNYSYLTDKNSISTNDDNDQVSSTTSKFENQATDKRISEVCPQPEENLEFLNHRPQLEDYALQPLMNPEVGDDLHDNNYIECNDFQSPIWS